MADYPISNVPRRIVYTGSAGVGPYAFPFEVLLNTDINVYKNDVLLALTADYIVTISPTLGTGTVTLVVAATGADRITIVGARAVQRTTDFTTGGDFFANTVNSELDSQTILTQQVAETAERSIKAPVTDPTNIDMTLPSNTVRAGKKLGFDSLGNILVDDFDEKYLGAKASNPTVDNNGQPLTIGALYFNTTLNQMLAFSSTGWTTTAPATASDLVNFQQAGTGAVARTVETKLRDVVSVKDFGAVGNGVANDTAAIDAAIAATLGKKLFFPSGTYLTDKISIISLTGVNLEGEDKYTTIIKSNTNISDHVISYINAVDCSLSNLTVDQNKAGKTAGHGIRFGGVDGITIQNVIVKSTHSYGIGFQAGTSKNVLINGFEIHDCGRDGIDLKDSNLANENINITNGVIYNYGIDLINQVAFDIRGPANVSNIQITCDNPSNRGFRFRVATVQGRAGSGVASNIQVTLNDSASYGFNIEGVTNTSVAVNNVVVYGGFLGVLGSAGCLFKNLSCVGPRDSEALSIQGIDNIIDGLIIDGALRGIDMEPNASGNIVTNFNIKNILGAESIRIQAAANNNTFTQGTITDGTLLSDSATGTIIENVRNWATSTNTLSAPALVDATGLFLVTVNPNLRVSPQIQDIQLTVVQTDGSPNDYSLSFVRVQGVPSSSNIGVGYRVETASATPGATIQFAVMVRTKGS